MSAIVRQYTAKSPHGCMTCSRTIEIGEQYLEVWHPHGCDWKRRPHGPRSRRGSDHLRDIACSVCAGSTFLTVFPETSEQRRQRVAGQDARRAWRIAGWALPPWKRHGRDSALRSGIASEALSELAKRKGWSAPRHVRAMNALSAFLQDLNLKRGAR